MSDTASPEVVRRTVPWQRWEPAAIQTRNAGADKPSAPPEPATPSPAEINRMIAQARHDAAKKGYEEGFAAGRIDGLAAGHTDGLAQGKTTGYEEGYAQAVTQARTEVTDETERLRALLTVCADELANVEATVGSALIELALDVARQVVRRELAHRPDTICAVVSEILHAAPVEQPALKIWLHPADVELVRLYLQTEHGHAKWRLFPDPTLARGGCRAESAHGAVDATLQTRWQRVAAGLGRESVWTESALDAEAETLAAPRKRRRAPVRKPVSPDVADL